MPPSDVAGVSSSSAAAVCGEAQHRFLQYLAAYNSQDLEEISSTHLSEECEVTLDGRPVLVGAEAIKPTYLKDWEHADFSSKPVTVVGQPETRLEADGTRAVVDVTLHKATDGLLVSLSYVFEVDRLVVGKMVRHCIHRVSRE